MQIFLRNLNVFLPCYCLLASFSSGPIYIVISLLKNFQYLGSLVYLLPAVPLVFLWWKSGLNPKIVEPKRRSRFTRGHWLVGGTNIAIFFSILLPSFIGRIIGKPELGMLTWFALPVVAFGIPTIIAGLYMIWSSGGQLTD